MIEVSKTRAKVKRDSKEQNLLKWARRNRSVLILASAPVSLLWLLGVVSMQRQKLNVIMFLLSACLLLACSFLIVALARIVEQLKAIRSELVMVRTHIDRGLLDDIATDITSMRAQIGKGVLGLLGM